MSTQLFRDYEILTFGKRYYRPIGAEPLDTGDAVTSTINETIDSIVFDRWRSDETYRPKNLLDWATRRSVDPSTLNQSVRAHDATAIVEGTARIAYGDKIFDAPAGTSVTLARKIPHAWGNASDSPLRMVITCSPGGVEEVLRLMVQGGKDTDLRALADKYGVQVVGPLLLGA